MVEIFGNSSQPESARPYGIWKPYISATMRVITLKQKPEDAHFTKLRLIKFSNQSIKLSEHEIYSNMETY